MALSTELEALVEAANVAIEKVHNESPTPQITDHSVGSAVLTKSGNIYTGVNIFHFVGGPCAESGALSNALQAGQKGEDFTHIVAVGNLRRGVVSPCGKCRQMLLDYYPHIKVIVAHRKPTGTDVSVVDVPQLLPYGYVWTRDRGFNSQSSKL